MQLIFKGDMTASGYDYFPFMIAILKIMHKLTNGSYDIEPCSDMSYFGGYQIGICIRVCNVYGIKITNSTLKFNKII